MGGMDILRREKGIGMKSIFLKCMIWLLLIMTIGCSAISELTRDGIGQPISTVVEHLGPPTRVTPDGKGGRIYIWEQWIPTGWYNGYLETTAYFVDSSGIIYNWR